MKGTRAVFILVYLAFVVNSTQVVAQSKTDSLLVALRTARNDTNKVDLLNKIAFGYSDENPEEGVMYGRLALELAEELQYKHGIGESYNSLGTNYATKSDYSKALEFHFKSLNVREEIGNKKDIATSLSNIGIIYDTQSDYNKAIEYYTKSLKYFEELNFKNGIAINLGNLGLVYTAKENYPEALNNINKALKIETELGDTNAMAICIGNIGTIYFKQADYAKALEYNQQGLAFYANSGNKIGNGITLCNIGEIYYSIAIDSSQALLNKLFAGNKVNALQTAEDYLNKAVTLFKDVGFLNGLQEVYKYLSLVNEEQNDSKIALSYFRQHMAFKDSAFNKESKDQIARIEKERSEDIQQKEIEIQKLQLAKARNDKWYFISGLIFLLLLLVLMYNRFRLKQKSNQKLQASYDNLKQTQAQLIRSEKMASLGQLSAGIAHEIQNPLNFVTNFSDLSTDLLPELLNANSESDRKEIAEQLKNNLEKITQHGKRAGSIVKGMLLNIHTGLGEKEMTDINKLCDEFSGLAFHGMRANNPGFSCDIISDFDSSLPLINIVPQDMNRVILNLTKNALVAVKEKSEHPNTEQENYKPQINLTTRSEKNSVTITIKDNGIGIPLSLKEKIFEPFFTTKTLGDGAGLGLSICYDIIKAHGGEIKMESVENKFTEFVITLPA